MTRSHPGGRGRPAALVSSERSPNRAARSRALDETAPPRENAAEPSAGADGADEAPPGLLAQLRAVRDQFRRLADAHVELAKAELADILDEVKRVAVLVGLAAGLLVFVGFLLPIGLLLFLGEWLFGSLGWGVLHGTEAFVAIAVSLVLAALGIAGRRLALDLAGAAALGVLVAAGLTAVGLGLQVGSAIGVAVAWLAWPVLMGVRVAREGIDTDALKARFWPTQTIETTKETIEWVRERTPRGPKS